MTQTLKHELLLHYSKDSGSKSSGGSPFSRRCATSPVFATNSSDR
jgi:hypothetical protein